ncbi:hypothetical protein KUE03_03200 [Lactobacillus gasseri CECT 5714]|uniref:hypothetical protein n=1 Tax=Lactobacillus gasseri TaxID=1596 RepID=UPI0002770055|nr:hypothetical protein [Lactobacillus gasseri]EJN54706.1 Hypothetical protein A131_62309 [Lactobacillus gasseri CECT 5714]MBV6739556.1 hypothetical protein [Lactobacillus gasseri CECT 5714]
MADIKFMNLSENGNPATTDSVLIGNSQDGLKRTTLGTIGNMFAVHGLLHFENVKVPTSTASGQITNPAAQYWDASFQVTAPNITGYTFKCWIGSQTNGFVCGNYVADPLNPTALVWVNQFPTSQVQDANSVQATALYVKNELA